MKRLCFPMGFVFVFVCSNIHAQTTDENSIPNIQKEAITERKETVVEDDDYEWTLSTFARRPLDINSALAEDLMALQMLSALEVRNFLLYRSRLGPLISIYELQNVPGWDIITIKKILPYIRIGIEESVFTGIKNRWTGGDASLLLRYGQVLEKSKGYILDQTGGSYYEGGPQKIFMRYIYNYRQDLSYGFTGDKDAGEPMFTKARKDGFDFYSFHFLLRRPGLLHALAIGDFTINMGQGLIQWQSSAFTKSTMTMAIKRESVCLRPYHSAGEYNFHRGLAIVLQKKNWESTAFISDRNVSTNPLSDTSGRDDLFSSFDESGYHRTPSEIAQRNNGNQLALGMNIKYHRAAWMIGFNGIHYAFSRSLQKKDEPYNLYALKGKHLTDFSLDYNYTLANLHLFGELATDHAMHVAVVQGALISLGAKFDMSFLYRDISARYTSLNSDAFTENTAPVNERGIYLGVAMRLAPAVQVNLYYDSYEFPWLKYRVDAPSSGKDFMIQMTLQPTKWWTLVALYKNENKPADANNPDAGTHIIINPQKERWRFDVTYRYTSSLQFTSQIELTSIKTTGSSVRSGYLAAVGMEFRKFHWTGNITTLFFETADYDTRIYLYEHDMLYNFSMPVFYGRGSRYYINIHTELNRLIPTMKKGPRLSVWIKWGQSFYPGAASIGSGLDEIPGNRRSELKFELLLQSNR